jgi:hypothetical protein
MSIGPGRVVAVAAALFALSLPVSQCSKPAPPAEPVVKVSAANAALLGDMTAKVSVKELMQYMLDPIADNIFDAVSTDIGPKGIIEHRPTTTDDWEKVKTGAVSIIEGFYLLKIPRPFAPEGDVNNSVGPNAPELSPTQIKALVDKDPVTWNAKIEALRNVGLEVLGIVNHVGSKPILFPNPFEETHGPKIGTQKDVDDLFQAAEDLDEACESCHLEYWYPGDKKDVEGTKRERARFEKPDQNRGRQFPKSTVTPYVNPNPGSTPQDPNAPKPTPKP